MKIASDTSAESFDRRRFLAKASALGAASFLGLPRTASAEPPPETDRITFVAGPALCGPPTLLLEELLHSEGFTEVKFFERPIGLTIVATIAEGKADMDMETAPSIITGLDGGHRVEALAGVHAGCYELFAHERVKAVRDLKGKTVAIVGLGRSDHIFVSSIVAYLGMDPRKDINWLEAGTVSASMRLFVEGKADVFLGFPPHPQELRAQRIGKVIIDTAQDRPWSQYFCCMMVGNREFVAKYPIATKRALRAVLKATDICANEPERAAKYLVAKGHEPRYEVALEIVRGLPYDRWREGSPEDSLRFYALRLHEFGMIKTSPQALLTQGTNWRFLNELRTELKG